MEPNWTELLEKEYGQEPERSVVESMRKAKDLSDKEIYQILESFW